MIVPEAATLLFLGGFARSTEPAALRSAQCAVYHVQKHLENAQSALYPERVLLCDRGTIDGAVYWPGDPLEYFSAVGTSFEAELSRYDAVLLFETAAAGGLSVEGGNPTRIESNTQALALDQRLRALSAQHPRFMLVPHNVSFVRKIMMGLALLEGVVAQLR